MRATYLLPLRRDAPAGAEEGLAEYLAWLTGVIDEVLVVDGSPGGVFAAHRAAWPTAIRHVAVDPARRCAMGKVAGVMTGLEQASHERVVIADDDVRYDEPALRRVLEALNDHDLVRPQNVFDPMPWHALWDTARTLLNRAVAADYPGTLAVRRSTLLDAGGYDGDVMFENLELIRTVTAAGGRACSPLDLYVRRLPPTFAHFWGQRTRQAYDDFAIPARMALWLAIVPGVGLSTVQRRMRWAAAGAAACVAAAERGRRRGGGAAHFPALASLLAPVWVLERGVCAWLAVLQRVRFGGVRYGDAVIPRAAHSVAEIRARLEARLASQ